MIRNAWHISGGDYTIYITWYIPKLIYDIIIGEGWCANSSCRRVLVTHRDGRQTVEEIKNDLGIGANDKEAMIANLRAQVLKYSILYAMSLTALSCDGFSLF
jgi:hypothetical protein